MGPIPESDLILNADGSIYHLGLLPEDIGDLVITVGDPDRVDRVSRHFDRVERRIRRREFHTHVGVHKNKRVTVASTGIGVDNVELVLTELDALVNIDLATRTIKPDTRKLNIIRIGTSGAIRPDLAVGAYVATEYAVGIDAVMRYYPLRMDEFEDTIATDIRQHMPFASDAYVVGGSAALRERFASDMHRGNTMTAPGFYAPQGRHLRIPVKYVAFMDIIENFKHRESGFEIHNFEMETAGYYAMARMMGHEMLSVNAILVNRGLGQFAREPDAIVDQLILKILDRI